MSSFLSNNLNFDSQHGFLKKRSTLSNSIYSIRNWLSSLNSGKSADLIYIELAKAFDSISHSELLHKLIFCCFSGKLYVWISTWLSGRTQTGKLGSSSSSPKSIFGGILQGSVVGTSLFSHLDQWFNRYLAIWFSPYTLYWWSQTLFWHIACFHPRIWFSCGLTLAPVFSWSLVFALATTYISIPNCSVLYISNSKLLRTRHYLIGNH